MNILKKKDKKLSDDEDYDLLDFNTREEATTTR